MVVFENDNLQNGHFAYGVYLCGLYDIRCEMVVLWKTDKRSSLKQNLKKKKEKGKRKLSVLFQYL